jgi:endogenous inhibitor of DNA gyrase (YacG/DUF329 family)
MTKEETRPCPSCPDGYVWTTYGQTGKTCPTCLGKAVVRLNGEPIRKSRQVLDEEEDWKRNGRHFDYYRESDELPAAS